MSQKLETFAPKLRRGHVIPQGPRIVFETEDPYNQITLPVALADLILLCSGQFTVREIVEKIYKRQGSVPFRSVLGALYRLHQGGFFENGHELEFSLHLQSWMAPTKRLNRWAWRFGRRIEASGRHVKAYYGLTLVILLLSVVGLQYFPDRPLDLFFNLPEGQIEGYGSLALLVGTSLLQSVRFAVCGVQLLLLTGKAYNVALRLSPWGIHLHVGDEANQLIENRLYTSMFFVSQIALPWFVVALTAPLVTVGSLNGLVLGAILISFWELNPFVNGEGRKFARALFFHNRGEGAGWHFDGGTLVDSLNPATQKRERDFARLCSVWGLAWLAVCGWSLAQSALTIIPRLSDALSGHYGFVGPITALAIWLGALYFVTQALVETIGVNIIKLNLSKLLNRLKSSRRAPSKPRDTASVVAQIEGLPLFSHFHEEFLIKITARSKLRSLPRGAKILSFGEAAQDLFVLLEGEVRVTRPGVESGPAAATNLAAGSVFGEAALVDQSPRQADVVAHTAATLLQVPVAAIREVALESGSVRQLEVFRNAILVNQYFASSQVFRNLSLASIDYLSSRGSLEQYVPGQDIFLQGDVGDGFYLLLRGSVRILVFGREMKRLEQGSFFGEIALIANIPRTGTVQCEEAVVCFKIRADAFWEVLLRHLDLGVFIETVSETRLREDMRAMAELAEKNEREGRAA